MITSLRTKYMSCGKLISTVYLSLFTTVSSMPAQALNFNFNSSFIPETSEDQIFFEEVLFAIEDAAYGWQSQLSDPVTVNIDINFGALPEGILGGARPSMVKVQYQDVLKTLLIDRNSLDDHISFENLAINPNDRAILDKYEQNGILDFSQLELDQNNSFGLVMNNTAENPNGSGSELVYLDNNGNENNKTIWMTTANAKALGLIPANNRQIDGEIRLSDDFNLWNISQEDGYDFRSTVKHEIGHILGFISGTDLQNLLAIQENEQAVEENNLNLVSTMDLFRYSEESASMGVNQTGVNDWTIGRMNGQGNPIDYYFSLDGGQTKIASFANGITSQASHWINQDDFLGIMNPTIKPGEFLQITDLDLQLLDVIGWDIFDTENSYINDAINNSAQLLFDVTRWNTLTYSDKLQNSLERNKNPQYFVERTSIEDILEQFLSRGRGASSSTGGNYWLSEDNLDGFLYATYDTGDFLNQGLRRGRGASSSEGGNYWLSEDNLDSLQDSLFDHTTVTDNNSATVPEPNLSFSLLGFGIFGVSSFLRKQIKK